MIPYPQKILGGGLLLGVVLAIALPLGAAFQAAEDHPDVDRILVDKSDHRLHLVADGEVVRSYRISLGSHPTGDKVPQDDKGHRKVIMSSTGATRTALIAGRFIFPTRVPPIVRRPVGSVWRRAA